MGWETRSLAQWNRRIAGMLGLLFGLTVTEGRALASEPFPPILAEKLQMDCIPNCLPCHTAAVGTFENQRADGIKLLIEEKAAGAVTSEDIFAAALDAVLVDAPQIDSDGDTTPDIVELKNGDNPYGGPALCERPLYGCFASHVSPALPTRLGALALSLGVAGSLLLRRRRTVANRRHRER